VCFLYNRASGRLCSFSCYSSFYLVSVSPHLFIFLLKKIAVGGEFTLIPPLVLACGPINLVKVQINK
jgi:hypothetical protein